MPTPSWLLAVGSTVLKNTSVFQIRVFQDGSLLGQGGPTPGVDGSYTVLEFFAEGNIPLLSNVTGAQALNLDLAYRYSDYSTSGGT